MPGTVSSEEEGIVEDGGRAPDSRIATAAEIVKYPDHRPRPDTGWRRRIKGSSFGTEPALASATTWGADVWVYECEGTYYMHYDGAGPKGWLCCLTTSKDLLNWTAKGPVLDFGAKGEEDFASASYGVTYFDGPGLAHVLSSARRTPRPRRTSSPRSPI